jgi:hypothetical protein
MDRRLLLALTAFGVLAAAAMASAQSRSSCDTSGKRVGGAKTDDGGAVTLYDASGPTARHATGRTDLYNGMICGFAGPCWNPSEKFGGRL